MSAIDKSEELLIQRMREGEEYAFEIAFLKYREPLCRYIWKFVRCNALAEEIVQEVFTNIWSDRKNLNPSGHLRGLLFEIARNKALDQIKHQKIVQQYISETKIRIKEDIHPIQQREDRYDNQFFRQALQDCINELPPRGRQIFELNRNEGLTYLEISEYLDISLKTVETHMRRVFQKLRERLSKYKPILLLSAFLGVYQIL